MAEDKYKEATHREGEGKRVLHHIRIHSHKGGHLVTHHAHNPQGIPFPYEEVPFHTQVFSGDQGQSLLAHVSRHGKVKSASPDTGSGTNPYEEQPGEEGGEAEEVRKAPKRGQAEMKGED